jgi:hypothetical protein
MLTWLTQGRRVPARLSSSCDALLGAPSSCWWCCCSCVAWGLLREHSTSDRLCTQLPKLQHQRLQTSRAAASAWLSK